MRPIRNFLLADREQNVEPIHVLHLIQGLGVGGMETMLLNMISHLDGSRFKTSVCCFDRLGPLAYQVEQKAAEVTLLKRKTGFDWRYPQRLASHLKSRNVQVLHLHNPTAFFYGALAGKLARVPCVVYTEHGRDLSSGWKVKLAHRWIARMVDRIVVVAEHGRRVLSQEEGVDKSKIELIYNGIDGQRFDRAHHADQFESIRKGLGLNPDTKVIGFVGRLAPIKNHAVLLKAMRKVVEDVPNVALLLIGDGPLKAEIESMVKEFGLDKQVSILGTRTDIPELMSIMDLFVLPSFSEGLSLTLIEACAAGLPIVATRVGGNEEVVVDQLNGLTVPSNDQEALAKAITSLLSDVETSRKMGNNARERFEERFTLQDMVQKYQDLYTFCLTST
jgi:sugar transferase (PEP-CTERM/EpsH1 system associated)